MFKKILIANRGEIAKRIIEVAKEMGIATVAVHSDVDSESPHVKLADEAVLLGPAPVSESYLKIDKIIAAAKELGADGIHPGYGLLSENQHFAQACKDNNIIFIGPPGEVIEKMGDKSNARKIAMECNVPIVPGSTEPLEDDDLAVEIALDVGFPVMVKAAGGGGGIGLVYAENEKQLRKALTTSRRRAGSAFGDSRVYIEKFIPKPRHIEVQIIFDHHGHGVHLFDRECTIQRRHQKVMEEAPSPLIEKLPHIREQITANALKLARAVEYQNAGTVEFIADQEGNFYFMEMNTRLQVEHPVTEMITGVPLIEWQLRIASGEPLTLKQEDLKIKGASIECRICAEDPNRQLLPAPGTIKGLTLPNARFDSAVEVGYQVSPFYDSLIGKLVVHGDTRNEAIKNMKQALEELNIEGVTNNCSLHKQILDDPDFIAGNLDTDFLYSRDWIQLGTSKVSPQVLSAIGLALELHLGRQFSPPVKIHSKNWKLAGKLYSL